MHFRRPVRAQRALRPVLASLAAAVLSACGGGHGDPATAVDAETADMSREQPLSSTTWKMVAWENQSFTVSGRQTVRFGIDGSWVMKSVSGTVPCTNAFFGRDPARGTGKQCQVPM